MRKRDIFVLSLTKLRRVCQEKVSSDLQILGGSACSILFSFLLYFFWEEDLFSHEQKSTKKTTNKTMYKRQSKEKTIEKYKKDQNEKEEKK